MHLNTLLYILFYCICISAVDEIQTLTKNAMSIHGLSKELTPKTITDPLRKVIADKIRDYPEDEFKEFKELIIRGEQSFSTTSSSMNKIFRVKGLPLSGGVSRSKLATCYEKTWDHWIDFGSLKILGDIWKRNIYIVNLDGLVGLVGTKQHHFFDKSILLLDDYFQYNNVLSGSGGVSRFEFTSQELDKYIRNKNRFYSLLTPNTQLMHSSSPLKPLLSFGVFEDPYAKKKKQKNAKKNKNKKSETKPPSLPALLHPFTPSNADAPLEIENTQSNLHKDKVAPNGVPNMGNAQSKQMGESIKSIKLGSSLASSTPHKHQIKTSSDHSLPASSTKGHNGLMTKSVAATLLLGILAAFTWDYFDNKEH